MNLKSLVNSIKTFAGLTRKYMIGEITQKMQETLITIPSHAKVVNSFGEDCAVIDIGDDENYLLFAAEAMWHTLMEADPQFAGYSSVLVNVNDVTVKGGTPIAILDTLAAISPKIRDQIVNGLKDGCLKFKVPVVGGHLNPDAPFNALTVAIIGMVPKKWLIRSDTARPGDLIVVAVDLDGHFHPLFELAWDTTTHKSIEEVEDRLKAIREIASKRLATAAKDISNPGVIGTLGMLLETSQVGGEIDITKIPKPTGVSLEKWVKAYPGFGVILTAPPATVDDCISIFHTHRVAAEIIGKVDDSKILLLTDRKSSVEIFNFKEESFSGKPRIETK